MKNFALVFLVSLLSISSFSQENLKLKNLYSVGLGYNYIGNDGVHGILFTNDFKWNFSKRFALNPGISFFQTVKNYNWDGWYRSHSGFIGELCLSSRIIDKVNSSLSLKIGPSFEIGDVSYLAVQGWEYDVLVEERYHNETITEGGMKIDIEYSWDETSRFTKSLSIISNSQYGMFPNSLGVVFKIGF